MIENELISAVLSQPEAIHDAFVRPEWFRSEDCARVWKVMLDLQERGERFDAAILLDHLQGDPRLTDFLLTSVNEAFGLPSNAGRYAEKIKSDWMRRREGDIGAMLAAGDIDSGEAIRQLVALDEDGGRFDFSITDAMSLALKDMEAAQEAAESGKLRGITTGLADLDSHLGGLHNGELTIIGARPKMGKTALLLHMAAASGVPRGIISAEQPAFQVAQRHVASLGKVSLADLRNGKIGENEMKAVIIAKGKLSQAGYWIHDRGSPSIGDVVSVARRWKHKNNIRALYVDYIQRINAPGKERHHQVGAVARALKTIARDLNIPVVALSQVNRDVESRKNRRPMMSDLSDSSELEKEADQILTLYRDEVYDEDSRDKGIAEISIVANRSGYSGTVRVGWRGEYVAFGDLQRYDYGQR